MTNRLIATLALFAGLLIAVQPLSAHHGNAPYDFRHPITVAGTVTEFSWINPHSLIYFDAKDAKGKVAHWVCETDSPAVLKRNGWSETSLKPGDQIKIILDPAKNGDPVGWSGAAGRHSVTVLNGPVLTFEKAHD